MNALVRFGSWFECNRTCIDSWFDTDQFTVKRAFILFGWLLALTFIVSTLIVIV